jgi:hypothetical protein
MIPFCKISEQKSEKFRQSFHINGKVSLLDCEQVCQALFKNAFFYFEQLISKNFLTKNTKSCLARLTPTQKTHAIL